MLQTSWPAAAGTYVLVLAAYEPVQITVGRLGVHCLPAGRYAYAGSARGPGGLAARLSRHARSAKACRWHIDYLRACLPLETVCWLPSEDNCECAWNHRLLALPGASVPIAGFGSSDCVHGCPAHLVRLPDQLDPSSLAELLMGAPGAS